MEAQGDTVSDDVKVDPSRLREAATTVASTSDIIGDTVTGTAGPVEGGMPGSATGPACTAATQIARTKCTLVSQRLSGWSASANANATNYERTDAENRSQLDRTGAPLPDGGSR